MNRNQKIYFNIDNFRIEFRSKRNLSKKKENQKRKKNVNKIN